MYIAVYTVYTGIAVDTSDPNTLRNSKHAEHYENYTLSNFESLCVRYFVSYYPFLHLFKETNSMKSNKVQILGAYYFPHAYNVYISTHVRTCNGEYVEVARCCASGC